MVRQLFYLALLWGACVAELGWETWTGLRVAPAFLDLAVVIVCLTCRPAAMVGWSGLAGLLFCLLHGLELQGMLILYATVALLTSFWFSSALRRPRLLETAFRSLVILAVLDIGRSLFLQDGWNWPSGLIGEHLPRVLASFLVALCFCLVLTARKRRSAWG